MLNEAIFAGIGVVISVFIVVILVIWIVKALYYWINIPFELKKDIKHLKEYVEQEKKRLETRANNMDNKVENLYLFSQTVESRIEKLLKKKGAKV